MIYDCFSFFNELDVLEIRLNVLDSIVDRFVLVEAVWTHAGNPKPLYFDQAKDEPRFAKFKDKIIHVVVEDQLDWQGKTWYLENYQRNAISRALTSCKADDIILVSDLDEIPLPEKVLELAEKARKQGGIWSIIPTYYAYYFNLMAVNGFRLKVGCNLTTYQDYLHILDDCTESYAVINEGTNPSKIRGYFGPKKTIANFYGWHFSFMGGAEGALKKFQAFAHQEFNQNLSVETIQKDIESGRLLNLTLKPVRIDESFPAYIRDNQDRFAKYILPKGSVEARVMLERHRWNYWFRKWVKRQIWRGLYLLSWLIPFPRFRWKANQWLSRLTIRWELRKFD